MEVLRSRVEESSTSANSSAQAKMMRQIEMLQTQHAIASQNWQRIEGSLQLRAEGLEKEKLDLTRKLEDERKRVKEAVRSDIIPANERLMRRRLCKVNWMILSERCANSKTRSSSGNLKSKLPRNKSNPSNLNSPPNKTPSLKRNNPYKRPLRILSNSVSVKKSRNGKKTNCISSHHLYPPHYHTSAPHH